MAVTSGIQRNKEKRESEDNALRVESFRQRTDEQFAVSKTNLDRIKLPDSISQDELREYLKLRAEIKRLDQLGVGGRLKEQVLGVLIDSTAKVAEYLGLLGISIVTNGTNILSLGIFNKQIRSWQESWIIKNQEVFNQLSPSGSVLNIKDNTQAALGENPIWDSLKVALSIVSYPTTAIMAVSMGFLNWLREEGSRALIVNTKSYEEYRIKEESSPWLRRLRDVFSLGVFGVALVATVGRSGLCCSRSMMLEAERRALLYSTRGNGLISKVSQWFLRKQSNNPYLSASLPAVGMGAAGALGEELLSVKNGLSDINIERTVSNTIHGAANSMLFMGWMKGLGKLHGVNSVSWQSKRAFFDASDGAKDAVDAAGEYGRIGVKEKKLSLWVKFLRSVGYVTKLGTAVYDMKDTGGSQRTADVSSAELQAKVASSGRDVRAPEVLSAKFQTNSISSGRDVRAPEVLSAKFQTNSISSGQDVRTPNVKAKSNLTYTEIEVNGVRGEVRYASQGIVYVRDNPKSHQSLLKELAIIDYIEKLRAEDSSKSEKDLRKEAEKDLEGITGYTDRFGKTIYVRALDLTLSREERIKSTAVITEELKHQQQIRTQGVMFPEIDPLEAEIQGHMTRLAYEDKANFIYRSQETLRAIASNLVFSDYPNRSFLIAASKKNKFTDCAELVFSLFQRIEIDNKLIDTDAVSDEIRAYRKATGINESELDKLLEACLNRDLTKGISYSFYLGYENKLELFRKVFDFTIDPLLYEIENGSIDKAREIADQLAALLRVTESSKNEIIDFICNYYASDSADLSKLKDHIQKTINGDNISQKALKHLIFCLTFERLFDNNYRVSLGYSLRVDLLRQLVNMYSTDYYLPSEDVFNTFVFFLESAKQELLWGEDDFTESDSSGNNDLVESTNELPVEEISDDLIKQSKELSERKKLISSLYEILRSAYGSHGERANELFPELINIYKYFALSTPGAYNFITKQKLIIVNFFRTGFKDLNEFIYFEYARCYAILPQLALAYIRYLKHFSRKVACGDTLTEDELAHPLYPTFIREAFNPVGIDGETMADLLLQLEDKSSRLFHEDGRSYAYRHSEFEIHLSSREDSTERFDVEAEPVLAEIVQCLFLSFENINTRIQALFKDVYSRNKEKLITIEHKRTILAALLKFSNKHSKLLDALLFKSETLPNGEASDKLNIRDLEALQITLRELFKHVLYSWVIAIVESPGFDSVEINKCLLQLYKPGRKQFTIESLKAEDLKLLQVDFIYQTLFKLFKSEDDQLQGLLERGQISSVKKSSDTNITRLSTRLSLTRESFFAKATAGLSTADNIWGWNQNNYLQFIVIDPDRKAAVGVVQLHLFDLYGVDSVLARFSFSRPYIKNLLVGLSDDEQFDLMQILCKQLMDNLIIFSQRNALELYIPENGRELFLSNNPEISVHFLPGKPCSNKYIQHPLVHLSKGHEIRVTEDERKWIRRIFKVKVE